MSLSGFLSTERWFTAANRREHERECLRELGLRRWRWRDAGDAATVRGWGAKGLCRAVRRGRGRELPSAQVHGRRGYWLHATYLVCRKHTSLRRHAKRCCPGAACGAGPGALGGGGLMWDRAAGCGPRTPPGCQVVCLEPNPTQGTFSACCLVSAAGERGKLEHRYAVPRAAGASHALQGQAPLSVPHRTPSMWYVAVAAPGDTKYSCRQQAA